MNVVLWIIVGAILLFILIIIGFIISVYNSLVKLRNNVRKSWSDIDVLLKQRVDEITKLVNTVKGYMKHEKGVLEEVTKARSMYVNASTIGEKIKADNAITAALRHLFAVVENYPNLKANENFMQLQNRITEIENKIASRRTSYNENVRTYNTKIQQFPANIIANSFNFKEEPYFEIPEEDRKDVKIQF